MATTDDTTTDESNGPQNERERHIEGERKKLMQAHAVLICLREVLLYAEDSDAVSYSEAANVAAGLVNEAVEDLESTCQ